MTKQQKYNGMCQLYLNKTEEKIFQLKEVWPVWQISKLSNFK